MTPFSSVWLTMFGSFDSFDSPCPSSNPSLNQTPWKRLGKCLGCLMGLNLTNLLRMAASWFLSQLVSLSGDLLRLKCSVQDSTQYCAALLRPSRRLSWSSHPNLSFLQSFLSSSSRHPLMLSEVILMTCYLAVEEIRQMTSCMTSPRLLWQHWLALSLRCAHP